jgi:hypothetical protein
LKVFYTLDLELRNEKYNKLIKTKIDELTNERNYIDEKLKYFSVKSVEFIYDEAAAWFRNEMNEVSSKWLIPSDKSRYGIDGYINLVKLIMNNGLLKITDNCKQFWKELEMYQKDEHGKIPKKDDHLINAFQYATGSLNLDFKLALEPKSKPDERRGFSIDEEINFNTSYQEID